MQFECRLCGVLGGGDRFSFTTVAHVHNVYAWTKFAVDYCA